MLAGFTQAHPGAGPAIELLSGLSGALVCFTAFFALLAALMDPVGAAWAFAAGHGGRAGLLGGARGGGRARQRRRMSAPDGPPRPMWSACDASARSAGSA